MLLCMLPLSAQEADTVVVQESDFVEVLPKGRLIPVFGTVSVTTATLNIT
jgi:hypothetical protein